MKKKVKKEEKKSKSKKSKKHHKKGKHKRKHHHKGKDKKKNEVETATPPPNIPGGIKLPSLPNPDMRPTFPEEDDPFWDEPVPNVIPALPTTEKKKITLDLDDEFSDDIEKDKKQNKVPSITNKTTTRSLLEDSSETDEIVPKKIVGIALPGLNTPPTLNKDEKSDEDLDLEKDNFETKNPEPKKVMIMGVPLPGFGLPPTPKISLLNKDKSSDDEWDKDDDENKEVAEPKKKLFLGVPLPGLNLPPPTLNKDEKSDEDLDLEKDNFETKNPEPKKVMIMGVRLPGLDPITNKISVENKTENTKAPETLKPNESQKKKNV